MKPMNKETGGDYLLVESALQPLRELVEAWRYRNAFRWLVLRELKSRYRHALLGAAWAILQPVATVVFIAFVFKQAVGVTIPEATSYSGFVGCGILVWLYFSKVLPAASQSMLGYADILRRNYIPRVWIVLTFVAAGFVDYLITAALLGLFVGCTERWLTLQGWIQVGLGTLWLVVFCTALSLWLAPLQVRFRDTLYAVSYVLQGLFFVTPVVFSLSAVKSEWLKFLIALNPLTGILSVLRSGFLGIPSGAVWAPSVAVTVVLLVSGLLFFFQQDSTLGDKL